ncbi:MAG: LCP family protein [Bacillota bacterium]
MNYKKSVFIWLGVFVVIGVLVLILGKLGYIGTGDSVVTAPADPVPQGTIDPLEHTVSDDVYGREQDTSSDDGAIDFDSIPGLTEGKKYSKKLVEEGSRNILFVGADKISGLYDTIGILSIDKKNQKLKIIMIPRDLYVDYNLKVKHYLELNGKANDPDFYKINSAHFIGPYMKYKGKFSPYSMNFLAEVIKEKFDIEVSDYVKVNTEGFVEIVNLFGGVSINVPYDMNYDDPFQDLSIHLAKGRQHLNGKQAEGFVRFRQGYDADGKLIQIGDLERKKNQTTFIKAFIEQHGTVTNIDKLPKLIGTLNKNLKHSIGFGDILTSYIGHAKDAVINKYEIESVTVTGKSKMINKRYYIIIGE